MQWEHKGITFQIEVEPMGEFFMASATVPRQGRFVRVRPFSALGRDEVSSIEMLKDQIRMKYRRAPELQPASSSDA